MDETCSAHRKDQKKYIKLSLERLKERDHPDDLEDDGKTILKLIVNNSTGKVLNGFIRFRIRRVGGLL
jgi:hypothetical protein